MRGMILAAGRGARMGSLTDEIPKPLIKINNRFLIEYSLSALVKTGIKDIAINLGYRGQQIKAELGDGSRYGIRIQYSEEPELLETGGGIFKALPLLGQEPFIVLSADVVTDFPLNRLPRDPKGLAHLVLVDNPAYHPTGDFTLLEGQIKPALSDTMTFSNIGIYRPELFAECQPGHFRLGNLLKQAIQQDKITGEYYKGIWYNIGTAAELTQITELPDIHF